MAVKTAMRMNVNDSMYMDWMSRSLSWQGRHRVELESSSGSTAWQRMQRCPARNRVLRENSCAITKDLHRMILKRSTNVSSGVEEVKTNPDDGRWMLETDLAQWKDCWLPGVIFFGMLLLGWFVPLVSTEGLVPTPIICGASSSSSFQSFGYETDIRSCSLFCITVGRGDIGALEYSFD